MRAPAAIAVGVAALGLASCWSYASRAPAVSQEDSARALADGAYCTLFVIAGVHGLGDAQADCGLVTWSEEDRRLLVRDLSDGEPGDAQPLLLQELAPGLFLAQLGGAADGDTYNYGVVVAHEDGFVLLDDAEPETVRAAAEEIGGLTLSSGAWDSVIVEEGAPEAIRALIARANAVRLDEIVADGAVAEDEATFYIRLDDAEEAAGVAPERVEAVVAALQAATLAAAEND